MILVIIFSILVALLLLFLLASFFAYKAAFYHNPKGDENYDVLKGEGYDDFHNKIQDTINNALKYPFEEMYIKSKDGLDLYGRFYQGDIDAPLHIQFNGYKGNGIRDFAGGLQIALSQNHNVICVDQRAHGKSSGHTISFGINERFDVLSWVEYANQNYPNKNIFIEGISMGAATVIMASSLKLDNVRGIIADCPYSSPLDITVKIASEMKLPKFIAYPLLVVGALLYGHFSLKSYDCYKALKENTYPILIIHGKADRLVPIEMSRYLAKCDSNHVSLIEFDKASHGISYIVDSEKYKIAIDKFVEEHLIK